MCPGAAPGLQDLVDHGDQIAQWIQSNHHALNVTYIIWAGKIWSPDRAAEGWRPYGHPTGAGDLTSLHYDHVHVSLAPSKGAAA
jgi:hypothetical protein